MSLDNAPSQTVTFTLNGEEVTADASDTIWEIAHGKGLKIPHLCFKNHGEYRPDGNCRACVVEVEGERVLTASCLRKPVEGMVVHTDSERVKTNRKLVFELLASDMPQRDENQPQAGV